MEQRQYYGGAPENGGSFYDEERIPIEKEVVEEPIPKPVEAKKPENNPGFIEYKLKKPFEFEGEFYDKLFINFESLTGGDVERAAEGVVGAAVVETDKRFHAALVARAAGVPREFLQFMSAKDYIEVTLHAQNFIMG